MPSYFDSQQNEGKDEDGRMSNDLEVNDILYAAQPKDKYDFRFFHHRVKFDEALMNPFTVNSPFLTSTYLGEIPIFSNTWMASKDDKFGDADTCPTSRFHMMNCRMKRRMKEKMIWMMTKVIRKPMNQKAMTVSLRTKEEAASIAFARKKTTSKGKHIRKKKIPLLSLEQPSTNIPIQLFLFQHLNKSSIKSWEV
mmetsp:Transcript_19441/g.21077  ORF Transcript_19441/g.21077 Transcript_19441/m.21077 type:complete len:195 (+) Transcript_19441:11-595(+)